MKKSPSQQESDETWMLYAFELAQKGDARVLPNPRVGAIYIKNNKILAEGWHDSCGEAHAERNANQKQVDLTGSTLYVSLEPCSHQGKTPPCVDYIIEQKVARVVYGLSDPANGAGGAQILRKQGIEVEGPFPCDGMLNSLEVFCCNALKKETYITAKWAMTLDGKIASSTGHSQWISGESSRKNVHQFRSEVDAIMIGAGTLLADDPSLDVRYGIEKPSPRPIIWDPKGVSHKKNEWYEKMMQRKPIVILSDKHQVSHFADQLQKIILDKPDNFKATLFTHGIYHTLVEGGAHMLGHCFDHDLIDQSIVYIAPKIIGGLEAKSALAGKGILNMDDAVQLKEKQIEIFGEDICIRGLNKIHNPHY
jgi:diaminohydroxyphosphoribosylaminopyrimidine deaminase / 5-amino-6-(5-phosphoribosylamino)uracil reductase